MNYIQATEKIAELVKESEYIERAGLIIMVFCDGIVSGETPKMAYTLAKNSIDGDFSKEQSR